MKLKIIEQVVNPEMITYMLVGEITISVVAELKNVIMEKFGYYKTFSFDLSMIDAIDSAGYHVLRILYREAVKQEKEFYLENASQAVLNINRLYGNFFNNEEI